MAVTREFHVRRIKSEDDPEIWVDVERVDRMIVEDGSGPSFQRTFIKLFWADEEADDEHPTRTIETKRLENPNDENKFIEIAVPEMMMFGASAATHYKKFVNDKDENTRREIVPRRVYHYDTASDPNDDGGTNYEKVEDSLDESQYIDTAVITTYVAEHGAGPGYIRRFVKLNTESVLEHSVESPADADLDGLVYLDPFQNIVNVNWGGKNWFVFGGSNGYAYRGPDGVSWTRNGSDEPRLHVGAVATDLNNKSVSTVYIGGSINLPEPILDAVPWLERSTDFGVTWERVESVGYLTPNDSGVVAILHDEETCITTVIAYFDNPYFEGAAFEYIFRHYQTINGGSDFEVVNEFWLASTHTWEQVLAGYQWGLRRGIIKPAENVSRSVEFRLITPAQTIMSEGSTSAQWWENYEIGFDGGALASGSIPGMPGISDMIVGKGKLVAIGVSNIGFAESRDNLIAWSNDGVTWTVSQSASHETGGSVMNAIGFASGVFVAVGGSLSAGVTTIVLKSDDAETWTESYTDPGSGGGGFGTCLMTMRNPNV